MPLNLLDDFHGYKDMKAFCTDIISVLSAKDDLKIDDDKKMYDKPDIELLTNAKTYDTVFKNIYPKGWESCPDNQKGIWKLYKDAYEQSKGNVLSVRGVMNGLGNSKLIRELLGDAVADKYVIHSLQPNKPKVKKEIPSIDGDKKDTTKDTTAEPTAENEDNEDDWEEEAVKEETAREEAEEKAVAKAEAKKKKAPTRTKAKAKGKGTKK